jgi:hypothetical protein
VNISFCKNKESLDGSLRQNSGKLGVVFLNYNKEQGQFLTRKPYKVQYTNKQAGEMFKLPLPKP